MIYFQFKYQTKTNFIGIGGGGEMSYFLKPLSVDI